MSFTSPVVPMTKLQQSQGLLNFGMLAPGSGEKHFALCVLVEIYDQERLNRGLVPDSIKRKSKLFPNKLYAKVRLQDGRYLTRPFKETAAQVYSTYGNSLELEGRAALIEFSNTSVKKGKLIPIDNPHDVPADMMAAVETYDIGMLV